MYACMYVRYPNIWNAMAIVMAHNFNTSAQKTEAGRSLWEQGQPGLNNEF